MKRIYWFFKCRIIQEGEEFLLESGIDIKEDKKEYFDKITYATLISQQRIISMMKRNPFKNKKGGVILTQGDRYYDLLDAPGFLYLFVNNLKEKGTKS